jgi:hypothetical protein
MCETQLNWIYDQNFKEKFSTTIGFEEHTANVTQLLSTHIFGCSNASQFVKAFR